MKIFANKSFKSCAAMAALALFASSAVYAACTTDCSTYANAKATEVRNTAYYQVYTSCRNAGGPDWSCQNTAQTNSQDAYNGAYRHYYEQCQSGNCV